MMNKDDDDLSDAEMLQEVININYYYLKDENEMTSKVKPKYDLKGKNEKTLKK